MNAAARRAEREAVANARRTEREAARRRKEMLRQHAAMVAARSAALAQYEAQMFENYLDVIVSLHKDSWTPWDWHQIAASPPPGPVHDAERAAVAALQAYQPTIVERVAGSDAIRRGELGQAVDRARQHDAAMHAEQVARWQWFRRLGQGIAGGDIQAYLTAVEHFMPFDELEELGAAVRVQTDSPRYMQAFVTVRDEEIVPREEVKLLASGKLSSKEMPKSKYWALYQDHVCSAALRVGRELFALLPIETTFVHVGTPGVNAATGHDQIDTLLSVSLERRRFAHLHFERLDASEAVAAFTHRMKFKKTTGFVAVEPLVPGQ